MRQVFTALACIGALALSSCATNYAGFIADAAFDPPATEVVRSASGEALELHYFDTQADPKGTIFFVSGSGCASLRYYLRHYFAPLPGSWRIYALQKRGVDALSTGFACSGEYYAHATLDEFLARNREALRWTASQRGAIDAVFGVSEGGGIAAELAAENSSIRRLVVIGSGGLTMREDLRILAHKLGQTEALNAGLAAIASDPESVEKRFLGHSYRYWSSALDIDPVPIYLRVSQPARVFLGEKDEGVPVDSAFALRDRVAAANRTNVSVEIVEGASHTLVRDGEDLKPAIMRRIGAWLASD